MASLHRESLYRSVCSVVSMPLGINLPNFNIGIIPGACLARKATRSRPQDRVSHPTPPLRAVAGLAILILFGIPVTWAATPVSKEELKPGITPGTRAEQQQRGSQLFSSYCAHCHLPAQFRAQLHDHWQGKTKFELFHMLRTTMPPEQAGQLTGQQYMDILVALLDNPAASSHDRTAIKVDDTDWQDAKINLNESQLQIYEQGSEPQMNWTHFRGDLSASAYAEAEDLTLNRFKSLKLMWSIDLSPFGPTPEAKNPSTPLVVDGVMYLTTGLSRNVIALDANTGQLLWMFRPDEGERLHKAPRKGAGRGVGYWVSGQNQGRIITITPGFQLVSLDAKSGRPVGSFGANGFVDLMAGLRLPSDGSRDIGNSSPPLIVNDVIIVGPAHATSMAPKQLENVKGDVRAYDADTGKHLWTFFTIPTESDPGFTSWERKSALTTGNAGVWAPMSADPDLGLVYLPVESSTHDIYGGHRPGANLYANSLVAVDIQTGKRRWHQQLVHHDLWDWDLPSVPMLVDVPGGKKVVVQLTKQGFAFVFDRETGDPVWPVVEHPVPPSDVPGEHAWPTQPIPTKPPAFERQGFSVDDIIDFTPNLHRKAKAKISKFRMGDFFAPPSLLRAEDGTQGTIILPGAFGGANWEGGAVDIKSGTVFISSMTRPSALNLKETENIKVPYVSGERHSLVVEGNIPIIKPPWGRITAIDLKSGTIRWQVANADATHEILNNPAIKGLRLPRLGKQTRSGLLVTPHFLIAGEGFGGDPILRAFDKESGKELAHIELEGTQTGLPMAFKLNGKTYLAMTVSASNKPAQLMVYSY